MPKTATIKPQRKLTSLELSAPARGALRRIVKRRGWTKTRSIELALLEMDSRLAAEGRLATFQLPIVFSENFRKTYVDAEILALTTGFDDGSGIGLVTLEVTIPNNANITAVGLLASVEYDNLVAKAGTPVLLSKEYTHNVQYAAAGDIEVATQLYNRDALQRVRLLTTADRITKVVVKMP
jgi:hypothetical protein